MPRVITLSGLGSAQPPFRRDLLVPPFVSPDGCQNPVLPTNKGCGGPVDCAMKGLQGLRGLRVGGVRLGDVDMALSSEWYMHPAVKVVAAAAGAASAYHGYRRTRSVGWAAFYGVMGALFPLIVVPVTLAQGWGKRA